MNGIKFKNFVREIKKFGNEEINKFQNELENLLKIEQELRPKKVYEGVLGIAYKVFNSEGEKIYKDVTNRIKQLKGMITFYKESVAYLGKIISAFDNDRTVRFIDKPELLISLLLTGLYQGEFSIEEASLIFGGSMSFNAGHLKGADIPNELKMVMSELGEFYNADGSFKITDKSNFKDLIAYCANYNEFGYLMNVVDHDITIPLDEFISMISNLQKEFMNNFQTTKIDERIPSKVEQLKKTKRKNSDKLAELRQYYKNKELINMPTDLEYFKELLNACQIDEKEQCYIFGLIKRAIKPKISQEDDRDKDLQESILDSCSINTTNLIFLKDPNGNNYFLDDLDQFNLKYQKMIMKILSKINHLNKNNFRPVIVNSDLSIKLYEVFSSDSHVIFYPLEEGIYLIIGASCVRGDYDRIINRFTNPSNKAYIEEIKNMLQNPVEREKLLAETVYPPELGQKRTRQI